LLPFSVMFTDSPGMENNHKPEGLLSVAVNVTVWLPSDELTVRVSDPIRLMPSACNFIKVAPISVIVVCGALLFTSIEMGFCTPISDGMDKFSAALALVTTAIVTSTNGKVQIIARVIIFICF